MANRTRIQEGMVFVSMTSDELLARTAQYQIQYSSGRYRRSGRRSGMQPSQEYLTGFRPPLQTLERTVLMSPHSAAVPHTAEDPQTQFRITTEYDENNEDSGNDEDWRSALLERTQAEQTEDPLSDTDESPSDEDDPPSRSQRRRQVESERLSALSRVSEQRLRHTPSLVHPNPLAEPDHPTAEVLKPHARFFIEREKSMVTIKFDPPPYVSSILDVDNRILTSQDLVGSFSLSCGAREPTGILISKASSPMGMQDRGSSQASLLASG